MVILRIDYCDERSDYYNSDISGPKGEINIINMSVKSPDLSSKLYLLLKLQENFNPMFTLLLFIQDFSVTTAYILFKFHKHVKNIHLEGTVSQSFYLKLGFDLS